MEFLKAVFEVFSRRPQPAAEPAKPVTQSFRNRVLLLCRDVIGPTGYITEFWEQIHQKLEYLHGTPVLSPRGRAANRVEDVVQFLAACESDQFLDFLEYIFRADAFWRVREKSEFIVQINSFFEIDGLPYHLTDYTEVEEAGSYRGTPATFLKVSSYPQVILKEHQLLHREAVNPALTLLSDPAYAAANVEFLDALQDYRRGDHGDCLTKCGSTFESVMKILCDQRGWPYQQSDTAATLLNTTAAHTQLDSFFIQPLMLVATVRNRLSKAHGAGSTNRAAEAQVAQYTVNATAAGVLLLVAAARRSSRNHEG